MLNMFTIIVILSNILIGQLSYRYETARDQGEKQYSIDKARYITKIEKSRIRKKVLMSKPCLHGFFKQCGIFLIVTLFMCM